ncbi:MAG: HPF/RaiA family ribosome-associated protein [Rugosibacter sp.]|nr:MAG: HPF/RaiA family ribosome-associated protein [Rugosibacter sp.]TBR08058.1 MAG: HPF/RaiA family ribosome-associated protein [Rugosibacter sp.]
MQIQVNAANNIEGHEALSVWASDIVKDCLSRQSEHITRVEVHLADENGGKSGPNDKRCTMEARLGGHPPIAVTHHSSTLREATAGAMDKLTKVIDTTLGKLRDQMRHPADLSPLGSTLADE